MIPIHDASNLRLQVDTPPAGLPNAFPDPNGAGGTWALSNVGAATSTFVSDGTKYTLSAAAVAGQQLQLWTAYLEVPASEYLRLRYTVSAITAGHTLRVSTFFYDKDKTFIAGYGSAGNDAPANVVGADNYSPIYQAPATAKYVRHYLSLYKGAVFTSDASASVSFKQLQIAHATTAAALAAPFAFTDFLNWSANLLGETHHIEVDRHALDLGTLSARVIGASLDPATGGEIQAGKAVRLQALVGATWEDVYVGQIEDAEVTYSIGDLGQLLTAVTLSAVDNIADLANAPQANGVATIEKLRHLIQFNAPVPFKINGNGNWVYDVTPYPAFNADASLLDQIAITRDTDSGYAWVDRHNVFVANDAAHMPAGETCAYTDVATAAAGSDYYSAIAAGFNTDELVNQVQITWLRKGAGNSSEEIVYGPYNDDASVSKYRARSRDFTLQGANEDPAAIKAFADAVIAANSVPKRKASTLTMPVRDTRSLGHAATVDLYDLVHVTFSSLIDDAYRVTTIKHVIDTEGWTVEYGFRTEGAIAAASSAPRVSNPDPTDGTWINANLNAPFTAAAPAPQYMRKNGVTYNRGQVNRNGAASGSAAYVLPVGYRPGADHRFVNDTNPAGTSSMRCVIDTNGNVKIYDKTGAYVSTYLDTNFPAEQ